MSLVSGGVASSFLSLAEALSASGAFIMFGSIATLSWLFVQRLVPETKGRSLETSTVLDVSVPATQQGGASDDDAVEHGVGAETAEPEARRRDDAP